MTEAFNKYRISYENATEAITILEDTRGVTRSFKESKLETLTNYQEASQDFLRSYLHDLGVYHALSVARFLFPVYGNTLSKEEMELARGELTRMTLNQTLTLGVQL